MMIVRQLKAVLRPFKARLVPNFNDYLGKVDGLVHVGANTGQERDLYESYGLEVIWIEPIPDVFAELQENIKGHPRQSAYQELITDSDGKEYEFRVASNHGQSSSIMDFKLHKDIWPDIQFTNTMHLRGITLATFFAQQGLDVKRFNALALDTQGSELLVLKGSLPILKNFTYVQVEVADFESYEGCCQLSELEAFMREQGYREYRRNRFAGRAEGGSYFDIVYKLEQ